MAEAVDGRKSGSAIPRSRDSSTSPRPPPPGTARFDELDHAIDLALQKGHTVDAFLVRNVIRDAERILRPPPPALDTRIGLPATAQLHPMTDTIPDSGVIADGIPLPKVSVMGRRAQPEQAD